MVNKVAENVALPQAPLVPDLNALATFGRDQNRQLIDYLENLARKANSVDLTDGGDIVGDVVVSGTLTVADEAYDATGWNGDLTVPTKNAVRDQFVLMPTLAGANTFTGQNIITDDDATAISHGGDEAPFEIRGLDNAGSAAYMAFHRPNSFAANFGIDTDNKWKVGGWSMGANAYEILHQNNMALYGVNPVGTVQAYAGTSAPSGWLLCYGQSISRTTYAALFAVLSTTFGSVDGNTFNVPDLRGRVIAGQDDMGGSSANRLTGVTGSVNGDTFGAAGGAETHTLTEAQMPSHTHVPGNQTHYVTANADVAGNTVSGANGDGLATAFNGTVTLNGATTTGLIGSDDPHNNVQPTMILNHIIFTGVA